MVGSLGEIMRPLIFRLRSLFMLKEIVAQKMYVKNCVQPVVGVENVLGNAVSKGLASIAGTAAAGTFVGAVSVPTGKRWRVKACSLWQTSAVALAQAACAVQIVGGSNLVCVLTAGDGAGLAFSPASASFHDLLLEPGDTIGIFIIVTGAAVTYAVTFDVIEDDFRENVV